MFILRLFDIDDRSQPIDARLLRDGELTIGRDPGADWVINDQDCGISRRHCEFIAEGSGLALRCLGVNGVFDDNSNERFPDDCRIPIAIPTTVRFGNCVLVCDYASQAAAIGSDDAQTLILSPPLGSSIDVPSDYSDITSDAPSYDDQSLLDSFCEGAGLDASAFSLEEPNEVMRRAGAVYRQMILGVGDLMAERERMRRQYHIAGTTIGGSNNNPFKWAPTQRLALDLLLAEERGFLSGPAALKASFKDIKKHLIATFTGLQHSLRSVVSDFAPDAIGAATRGQGSILKAQSALNWEETCRRHADLSRQIEKGEDGSLSHVFIKAYDVAVSDLERQQQ